MKETTTMLTNIGIALIVLAAILFWQSPFLGLSFGILLALIGFALIAAGRGRKMFKALTPSSLKVCPDCKAPIPGDASVCMHCGYRYASV